ncbi:uncharacterized protein LOC125229821 [Leguminivora glycinivorella]|uniref:uncharacterized protein LOC125229821 n=1 Tax=Leguminivora glycinivorella TaxID=1035111 RepID=UPI00200CB117|nr:uncharacterized protein LOC125229821 [Leguminivora glycinivorella]
MDLRVHNPKGLIQNRPTLSYVADLTTRLDITEQHNRASNIELHCIPEHRSENLLTVVKQIGRTIACEVTDQDIHLCTRVAKKNQESTRPRSVVVKFGSPRIRDQFLAQVVKFNKANPKEKLHTGHLGIGGDKKPVYVAEHLSPKNKSIQAAARQVKRDKGYKWTQQGRVFLRKTETSEYICIKSLEDLQKIV